MTPTEPSTSYWQRMYFEAQRVYDTHVVRATEEVGRLSLLCEDHRWWRAFYRSLCCVLAAAMALAGAWAALRGGRLW